MTKKLLFLAMTLLALAAIALAQDAVTGKWVYEQAGRQGGPARQTTLDLKADGAKLTGTATQPGFGRGGDAPAPVATPITNGKVDGTKVSFDVSRDFGGESMITKYEGTVAGSELKMKVTMPGFGGGEPRTVDVVAKKQ
jgi:hypothetical protein